MPPPQKSEIKKKILVQCVQKIFVFRPKGGHRPVPPPLNMPLMTYITFNGPLSRTTRVSRYQKGKTSLDFTEARDSKWQWHHLGHMQVCTSLRTDNHASTPPLSFFTDRMPLLPPNQQRQSTEGKPAHSSN